MTVDTTSAPDWKRSAPVFLAGASTATSLVSIAASQILLGLAIVALILNPRLLRWPRVGWPMAAFMAWTLVALATSPDPAGGFPQIKKFYVYLMLWTVFSAVRTLGQVRWIAAGWATGAALSSLWGFVQYIQLYRATPDLFYLVYNNSRITGFMGHWMTLSGTLMMALMMTGALILFGADTAFRKRWNKWLIVAGVIAGVGLLVAFTRSMYAGAAVGAMWLLWVKRPWMIALVPLVAALVLALNPLSIRDRVLDIFQPTEGVLDATSHRQALREAGYEMMKAHPLTGVGPEQVQRNFERYLPAAYPRPIPVEWYYAHLHNVYVHYGAERGIPALLALLWMFGQALWDFGRGVRRLPGDAASRWVLHGAIASILAVMVSGLGEVNLGDSEVLGMFLGVVACGYVALESGGAEQAASKNSANHQT